MLSKRIISRALRLGIETTLVTLSVLGVRTSAAAECSAPSYRRGFVWEDSPSSIMMNVSIAMSDFAPDRLACLAEEFKQRYKDRKKILVLFFSTRRAADRYTSPSLGEPIKPVTNWALRNHGLYSFDADKREEHVKILPFGPDGSFNDFDTTINLPTTSRPACTLEMAGRCLLALNTVDYPWDALKASASGGVTLEGEIARDGIVKQVRIVRQEAHPSDSQGRLVNAAVQNLKTWRFEAAPHPDSIRITYAYTIDASFAPGHVSVQFRLPGQVEIRGRPPR